MKKGQYLSGTFATGNFFNEEIDLYDKNGNIKNLKRYALNTSTASAGTLVDNLTLIYKGNQIATIADAVSVSTIGFVMPGNAPANPVVYNINGAINLRIFALLC